MPFELLQKKFRSAEEIRKEASVVILLMLNFPMVLNDLIGQYITEEPGFNHVKNLTNQQKARLLLITFSSIFEAETLTPGVPISMLTSFLRLPGVVIEQHKRMGFSVKKTICPRYSFYIDTKPGAEKYNITHGDISTYRNTLTDLSLQSPEGDAKESRQDQISDSEKDRFDGQKLSNDSGDRIELHVPYQLVLVLEMAKQKAYEQVIQTDFKKENVLFYLMIVKNLEKAKFFYKGLGYLDLGPTTAYISSKMYEVISRFVKEKQPLECKFPKASNNLDIMRWALVTDGIRCPQLEYSQSGGYVSVMPKESVEKLLQIPGITELYDQQQFENESMTAKEFMMRIKVSLSEQDEKPTKRGRLAVLETFVISLERIYGDASGSNLSQIIQEIDDQNSAMSKFLLPPPKLFSLFKEPQDSYDAAIFFLALRMKEVETMQTSLKTQMPELDEIVNGSSTSPSMSM